MLPPRTASPTSLVGFPAEHGWSGRTVFSNRYMCEAIDKQKTLLSADVGHFSLVRAMHLADLITLMNGMRDPAACLDGLSVHEYGC